MVKAVIYSVSRNVMQSNMFSKNVYIVRLLKDGDYLHLDDLMGWSSSSDMTNELSFTFSDLQLACNFASNEGYDYFVLPKEEVVKDKKSYAHNITKNRNLYYY